MTIWRGGGGREGTDANLARNRVRVQRTEDEAVNVVVAPQGVEGDEERTRGWEGLGGVGELEDGHGEGEGDSGRGRAGVGRAVKVGVDLRGGIGEGVEGEGSRVGEGGSVGGSRDGDAGGENSGSDVGEDLDGRGRVVGDGHAGEGLDYQAKMRS